MDIVERLRSHWGGERIADVSIDVADAANEIERLRIRNDKVKNKWKESTSQFKVWKRSFWSEERKAADKIETLTHEVAEAKVEIKRLRNDKSVLITSFRINMMRLCPDYSHDEFDKDIAAMMKEKE